MFQFRAVCLAAVFSLAPAIVFAEEDVKVPERFEHLDSVAAFDEVMATMQRMRDTLLQDATSEREAAEAMTAYIDQNASVAAE